jgi:probable metal-binding protein
MQTQIHGHEVIAMISESKQAYTRDSLTAAIVARFGADARFHTCSAEGMTAPELVTFLETRGKFMPIDGGFTINPARVCAH